MTLTNEYLELKARVEKQRKVVAQKQALVDKQTKILKEMLSACTHEELKVESSYFGGSYYDHASTEYWNRCTLCGERGESTTISHSYYG